MSSDIRQWIREHKVCWELSPYLIMKDDIKIQVGFELHLLAQHIPGENANPGCAKCQEIFVILQRLARIVLPKEIRPTQYEITSFDGSFHLRRENRMKEEVQLTLLITHRNGFFNPVDDCEQRCAGEIEKNLKDLGAQHGIWLAGAV